MVSIAVKMVIITPGKTQLRVSFCENPDLLRLAPELLSKLFRAYEAQRNV